MKVKLTKEKLHLTVLKEMELGCQYELIIRILVIKQ